MLTFFDDITFSRFVVQEHWQTYADRKKNITLLILWFHGITLNKTIA